ncbi:Mediator of RNA polymerase II transcription subunit 12 [Nakaseomyces bracarensis]|uniref:Mediator of RNA polymerase II transcription subunit 12 n=1 Tax=Nakaseomyces bracarensis TaxID=273131 RepID=A0ABR4NT25_9SACH
MVPNKYLLTPPDELNPYSDSAQTKHKIYPDFDPWQHTKEEDDILLNFVSKGYYSTSKVNFESISARSSLQESLPKLSSTLSEKFSHVVKIREQEINKISGIDDSGKNSIKFTDLCSPNFKLPSRLTLTDHRKELWIQELSSPYTSLHKITNFIPHGLKKRQVLEQCYQKQILLIRAIWLIKCCYSIEWKSGIAKHNKTAEEKVKFNAHLLKEWTDNFVFILEKLIFEMTQHYNDPAKMKVWKKEVNYLLRLIGNCYTLELIDKELFHHWILQFVSKVENLEYLPLPLHILELFWSDICDTTNSNTTNNSSNPLFLVTRLTEVLLSKYYNILHSKSMINDDKYIINDIKKNDNIKESLLIFIQKLVCRLFKEQSLEIFLFPPESWENYKPCLIQITSVLCRNLDDAAEIKQKLELISYRNETLRYTPPLSEKPARDDLNLYIPDLTPDNVVVVDLIEVDTKLTNLLDENPTDFDWTAYADQYIVSKVQIIQIILWAIHPSRKSHYEASQLAARLLLLKINTMDGFPEYEIEDEIWSLVFKFAKLSNKNKSLLVVMPNFYSLLNTLIIYGLIKVPTYIRKLISSGILYLTDTDDKYVHCKLLINLKMSPLMESLYNMVLKNVMDQNPEYYQNYNFHKMSGMVEELKAKLTDKQEVDFSSYPISIKISVAEWYLTYLCNGILTNETTITLSQKYYLFSYQLNSSHLYFKWIEFVVYHQLINDISALEYLMDLLLNYQKLFSQYINDHVLFIKTFIFITTKILREKDTISYKLTSFMPFWKFIMKNYPIEIRMDNDLRTEIASVYEEEKAKKEIFENEKDSLKLLYQDLNPNSHQTNGNITVFSELFLTNLKCFLSSTQNVDSKMKARYNLLLLMQSRNRDYSKFISIYLKRKDFKNGDLIALICSKLLTLDQIKNTYGLRFVLDFFDSESEENCVFYEYQKKTFIWSNFQSILNEYDITKYDELNRLVLSIVKYSSSSKLKDISTSIIIDTLKRNPDKALLFFFQILHYQSSLNFLSNEKLEQAVSQIKPYEIYIYMDFTNLWIFQAYTRYYVELLSVESPHNTGKLKDFIFSVVEVTNNNILCAKIFEHIKKNSVTDQVIEMFEHDFFDKVLSGEQFNSDFLQILIEIINPLSVHTNKASRHTNMPHSEKTYELFIRVLTYFNDMNSAQLAEKEIELDVYMKIFTVHQNTIFKRLLENIEESELLIDQMFSLFDKVSFSLRLKLMLYEILSSLKSYSTYSSSTVVDSKQGTTPSKNVVGNSVNNELPKKLEFLPPFQVSSFFEDTADKEESSLDLGLDVASSRPSPSTKNKPTTEKIQGKPPRWLIYNKSTGEYIKTLQKKPYYCINNYQQDSDHTINNCSLNLSLFDARYERNNPR